MPKSHDLRREVYRLVHSWAGRRPVVGSRLNHSTVNKCVRRLDEERAIEPGAEHRSSTPSNLDMRLRLAELVGLDYEPDYPKSFTNDDLEAIIEALKEADS